jgi:two-component system cell cycle sensor histidine kinase/response regulator CckA
VEGFLGDSVASFSELRVRLSQQEAVAGLSQLALSEVPTQELCDQATRVVAAELEADYASLLELCPDRSAFLVRSSVGWPPALIEGPISAGRLSQAGYTMESSAPVIMLDAALETRFSVSRQAAALGITSGISTCVGANGGTYGVLSAHVRASRDFSGDDVTFLVAVANVLASSLRRRRAEEEAEKTHRVLAAVIEGTSDAVFVKDLDGRFVALNGPAAQVLGLERDQLIGHTLHEIASPETADTMAESDGLILARGTVDTFEESVWVDDEERVFLTTKGPYRARDGTLLGTFGIARDITARKAQERALRAARDYADRLIETSNAIVLVLDADANILTFNKAAEEITGYTRDEVLGRNWDLFLPRDRYPDPWIEHEHLVDDGTPEHYANPILTRSGEERMIIWRNNQLRDHNGSVIGTVSFGIDATDMMAAEAHAVELETRLRQAEKLEALGQFAGGVAHDFNNLLLAIHGYGDLALAQLGPGEDGPAANIRAIIRVSEQAAELTAQVLAFGRRQVLNPEVLDLNDVVRETATLLRRVIGEHVETAVFYAEQPVPVSADRGQLAQVITNLALNARDAMPAGGLLTIRVTIADRPDTDAKPLALLSVSDEGCGIDETVASRIFEPFFTTKQDTGTGLGLATVYGIVAQSGGEVTLETELGHGSTFNVYLPLCSGELTVSAKPCIPSQADGTETILLVEDDPMVRSTVSALLALHGYQILEAATGDEAIRLFETREHPIPLVISDLIMRGLDGHQTVERIRELEPATKALYMSGYTDNAAIRRGPLGHSTGFIQKPFGGDELAARIRQLLDTS